MVETMRREAHTGHTEDTPATWKGSTHEFDTVDGANATTATR